MTAGTVLWLRGDQIELSRWQDGRLVAEHAEAVTTRPPSLPIDPRSGPVLLLLDVDDQSIDTRILLASRWWPANLWRRRQVAAAMRRARDAGTASRSLYTLDWLPVLNGRQRLLQYRLALTPDALDYLSQCLDAGLELRCVRSLSSVLLDWIGDGHRQRVAWRSAQWRTPDTSSAPAVLHAIDAAGDLHLLLTDPAAPTVALFVRRRSGAHVRAPSRDALVGATRAYLAGAGLARETLDVAAHTLPHPPAMLSACRRHGCRREFETGPLLARWFRRRRIHRLRAVAALSMLMALVLVLGAGLTIRRQHWDRADLEHETRRLQAAATAIRDDLQALPVRSDDVDSVVQALHALAASPLQRPVEVLQAIAGQVSRHPRLQLASIRWRVDGSLDAGAAQAAQLPLEIVLSGQVLGDGDLRGLQNAVRGLVRNLASLPHLRDIRLQQSPLGVYRDTGTDTDPDTGTHTDRDARSDSRAFSIRLRLAGHAS